MTTLASMANYTKGTLTILDDDPRRYVLSNIFEIGAAAPVPYRKLAVARNGPYVIECYRAEGVMTHWLINPHDEFVLVMEGELRIDFREPAESLARGKYESIAGTDLGYAIVRLGNLCLLPKDIAYRVNCAGQALVLQQAIAGADTVYAWDELLAQWQRR